MEDILILLTYQEAIELKGDLDRILETEEEEYHAHLDDEEYQREITIALYDESREQKGFKERIIRLIKEGE